MRKALVDAGHEPDSAEIARVPTTTVPLEEKDALQTLRLLDRLEDLDDVQTGLLQRRLPGRSARCVHGLAVLTAPVAPAASPLVLGIDPGLRVCGWGVVRGGSQGGYVACGAIKPRVKDTIAQRLLVLHQGIEKLIEDVRTGPRSRSRTRSSGRCSRPRRWRSGRRARRRCSRRRSAGLEVEFYAPTAVKAAVSGYGQGDKRQVQAMVRMLLASTRRRSRWTPPTRWRWRSATSTRGGRGRWRGRRGGDRRAVQPRVGALVRAGADVPVSQPGRNVLRRRARRQHVGAGDDGEADHRRRRGAARGQVRERQGAAGRGGYEYEGDNGVAGRESFRLTDAALRAALPEHHLYVCEADSEELRRHRAFREFLRAHPDWVAKLSAA